ncbi:MAG: hypothetical protein R3F61_10355 [Myxococcota bacterium]
MRNLVAGILIGGILVGGLAGGYVAYEAATPTPAEAMCAHLVEVCEPEGPDAYTECVASLDDFAADASEKDLERLTTCVVGADGCAEASGCLVGAGLKQAFGEVGGFIKGVGNALGFGK